MRRSWLGRSEPPGDPHGTGTAWRGPRRSAPGWSLRETTARHREIRARRRSGAAAPETRRAAHTWLYGSGETIDSSRRDLSRSEQQSEFHWPATSLLDELATNLAGEDLLAKLSLGSAQRHSTLSIVPRATPTLPLRRTRFRAKHCSGAICL